MQIVQIDLRRGLVLNVTGYAGNSVVNGRTEVASRVDDGPRSFFVRGAFYDMKSQGDLERWLRAFDESAVGEWAAVPGDFNVVVWDREQRRVMAVSDRTGAHRLYIHAAQGIVSVSGRLLDQARLQPSPSFDEGATYSMLAFGFPCDPDSLLSGTFALSAGYAATASVESGAIVQRYYTPITESGPGFRTVAEAVAALDEALKVVFGRIVTGHAKPVIMMSGGIDSLIMLKYASRLTMAPVDTLTFAIEGQHNHELREGELAASYFGSRHHQVVLPTRDIVPFARSALCDSDYPGYGAFQAIGVRNYLERLGTPVEVCRGEDTRLPSPAIDLPARIAIAIHQHRLGQRPLFRTAWSVRSKAVQKWPLRRGQNYLRFLEHRTNIRPGLGQYLLEEFGRYLELPGPSGAINQPPWIAEARQRLDRCQTLDDVHHGIVGLGYSLQYTEDMHCTIASSEFDGCRVVFPFMTPEFVQAAARVPVQMGLRSRYVGSRRTRSPFPFVDKYLLREVLGPDAPAELRFRRKSTSPAMDLCYRVAGPKLFLPLIDSWGQLLLEQLPGGLGAVVGHYREEILGRGVKVGEDLRLGWLGMSIAHLATVARVIAEPTIDLEAALAEIETGT